MSYNAELRERDKKFKELQQEVRVLMENIKSDIIPLLSSYEYLIKKSKGVKVCWLLQVMSYLLEFKISDILQVLLLWSFSLFMLEFLI